MQRARRPSSQEIGNTFVRKAAWKPDPPVLRHASESALDQAEKGLHDCTMAHKSLILCVDDMASVLEGRQMLLEMYGYKVLPATNGTEAVKAFVTNPVDLVLLDYYMPEEN